MVIDTVSINISSIIIHLLRETENHILPILNHLSARNFVQCFTAYIYFPFLLCFSFCCFSLMQIFLICDAGRKCLAHYTWLGHKQGICSFLWTEKCQKISFWVVGDIITLGFVVRKLFSLQRQHSTSRFQGKTTQIKQFAISDQIAHFQFCGKTIKEYIKGIGESVEAMGSWKMNKKEQWCFEAIEEMGHWFQTEKGQK